MRYLSALSAHSLKQQEIIHNITLVFGGFWVDAECSGMLSYVAVKCVLYRNDAELDEH